MSNKKIPTRELILDKALELINEKGVEYVGLREIASILGIRVSNISYYFPTKDDLVNHFTLELKQLNEDIFREEPDMTVSLFFEKLRQAFNHQVKYRGIMLSVVHIMKNNRTISQRYKVTLEERHQMLFNYLETLGKNGYLRVEKDTVLEHLGAAISIIARFWISESAISYKKAPLEDQVGFNLSLIASLLEPHCTVKGRRELEAFLR